MNTPGLLLYVAITQSLAKTARMCNWASQPTFIRMLQKVLSQLSVRRTPVQRYARKAFSHQHGVLLFFEFAFRYPPWFCLRINTHIIPNTIAKKQCIKYEFYTGILGRWFVFDLEPASLLFRSYSNFVMPRMISCPRVSNSRYCNRRMCSSSLKASGDSDVLDSPNK